MFFKLKEWMFSTVISTVVIVPVVSGKSWKVLCFKNMSAFCRKWKSDGAYAYQTPDGKDNALISYQTLEDAKSFDALAEAGNLTALTLLVAADNDTVVPPQDVRRLYSRLPVPKYMAIIADSSHNFVSSKNQDDLAAAIGSFLKE